MELLKDSHRLDIGPCEQHDYRLAWNTQSRSDIRNFSEYKTLSKLWARSCLRGGLCLMSGGLEKNFQVLEIKLALLPF
jgi:glutaredoxin-related protein